MILGRPQEELATIENKDDNTSAVADVDDVITSMWDGLDIDTSDENKLQEAGRQFFWPQKKGLRKTESNLRKSNLTSRAMVLLGPFDSGTHLLINTLRDNYKDEVYKACAWDRITIDNDKFSHCRVWKHGLNISDSKNDQGGNPVYTVLARQGLQLSDVVVVMMVRSP
eukprot:CAMPEP_0185902702 /NCGR_PEP_ID=MMETSP0196C-20130402/1918_1 /TAXON_ID=2932 /ORGANISM="Alexandrium fundyense, Strain CCMP1719" /LENGTH=167 /DNA_ID=CAMNT_0028621597 /DNA_START=14 /DNA_END=514 /DNA_ORIENTATION=+